MGGFCTDECGSLPPHKGQTEVGTKLESEKTGICKNRNN